MSLSINYFGNYFIFDTINSSLEKAFVKFNNQSIFSLLSNFRYNIVCNNL